VPSSPDVLLPKDEAVTRLLRAFFAVNPLFVFMTANGVIGIPDRDLVS
jgi:hypothetical protein